ncbi:MAG: nucleotidyltransferase domain-containing protein, partial [Sulfuricaulis sp.]|nr:nucleotidyltransferase domain-containing protein [Sulfuricaulis sp.]
MTSVSQTPAAPVAAAQSLTARWKTRLGEQRRALELRYLEHHSAPELLRRLRMLVDGQLNAVWQHLAMPPALALVAVGGYGRGQLFPYSDIDLLILLPPASAPDQIPKLEQFVGTLWD